MTCVAPHPAATASDLPGGEMKLYRTNLRRLMPRALSPKRLHVVGMIVGEDSSQANGRIRRLASQFKSASTGACENTHAGPVFFSLFRERTCAFWSEL